MLVENGPNCPNCGSQSVRDDVDDMWICGAFTTYYGGPSGTLTGTPACTHIANQRDQIRLLTADNLELLRIVDLCNPEVRYAKDQTPSSSHNAELARLIQEIVELSEKEHPGQQLYDRVRRWDRGELTPQELQNICHNLTCEDRRSFFDGCTAKQREMFGTSREDEIQKSGPKVARLIAACQRYMDAKLHAASAAFLPDAIIKAKVADYDAATKELYVALIDYHAT